MQCKVKCFKCDLNQTYHINNAAYHGACDNELITQDSFENCVHCNSVVFCCIAKTKIHKADLLSIENKSFSYINSCSHSLPVISFNQNRSKTVKVVSVLKNLKIAYKDDKYSINQSDCSKYQFHDCKDEKKSNEHEDFNYDNKIQKSTKIEIRNSLLESDFSTITKAKETILKNEPELEKFIDNPSENIENLYNGGTEELFNHCSSKYKDFNNEKLEDFEHKTCNQWTKDSNSERDDYLNSKAMTKKKKYCSKKCLFIFIFVLCILIGSLVMVIGLYFN